MAENEGRDAEIGSAGSGIDRRSLIKKAAIVGGAAWTAPVILGSIASPAGAVTVTPGCYQMYTFLQQSGTWAAWTAGTLPLIGCDADDACADPQNATDEMRTGTALPSPVPADNSRVPVSVTAPSGCRIGGVGVYVRSDPAGGLPDTCATAISTFSTPEVDFTIPLGRASVTIQPKSGATQSVWDNEGVLRSSIFLRLLCP